MAPPALRASGRSAISTQAVSLDAISRCSRSHVVNGNAPSTRRGTSARSSTTTPNPPALSTSAVALSARETARCSGDSPPFPCTGDCPPSPRTQSSRSRTTPAETAEATSNRSSGSMQAASSPRAVVPASSACTSAVRPVDPSPVISEICPRAMPPPSDRSSASCPIGTARSARSGPADGSAVVSVVSSLRVRSRDSSAARATAGAIHAPPIYFRFIFAIRVGACVNPWPS